MRRGSLSPSGAMYLWNSAGSISRCGRALWPFSISELARRPRMPRLLRRPPAPAPPFLRNSLLRLMMGVSLKGSAIIWGWDCGCALGVASCSSGWSSISSSSSACRVPFPCGGAAAPLLCGGFFSGAGSRAFRRVLDLGTTNSSSGGGALSVLDFLFVVLLVAGADAAAAVPLDRAGGGGGVGSGGGEARRRVPALGGLPTLFFTGTGSSSTSSGIGAVLTRFDPRVNRKSPSCSSNTAGGAAADDDDGGSASAASFLFLPLARGGAARDCDGCDSSNSWLLGSGRDGRRGSDDVVPARRLLWRRSGWLLMLKTCSGGRVWTRVVMDDGGAVGA